MFTDLNTKIKIFLNKRYGGVVYFMIILITFHFIWKFTMIGDESDTKVTFLGLNISAPFNFMAGNIAESTHKILIFFGDNIKLEDKNILRQENGNAVRIVWACSGIKQAYILFCIIAFYKGPIRKKLWYIPLGIFLTYLFNIFRITVIAAIINSHPEWFEFVHEHLFKYLFYGLIFGIWVFWDNRIANVQKTAESETTVQ